MEKRYWKILLIIGILFHLLAALIMPIGLDAHVHSTYVTDQMDDGEGHLEWGELRQESEIGSTPSESSSENRWFAWHIFIEAWFTLFGASLVTLHVMSLIVSLGCLATIFLATRGLFGVDQALKITALASIYPPLIRATGRFYQENAILLVVTISSYCIIKYLQSENKQPKWLAFPILSIFILASFKGMPLWMGIVAIAGFYVSTKFDIDVYKLLFIAISVELFVIWRNGISILQLNIILALLASVIAAIIFLYCAVLLGKNMSFNNKNSLIIHNGTILILAVLIGWVAGLWVSESYYQNSSIFEVFYKFRNNPRYLTLLFVPLLYSRLLEDDSYELISEKNKSYGYSFLIIMVVINAAVLSLAVGERGTQIIGEQLNSDIESGQDILFISDANLAMHRMYTMHLTLDPESDNDNLAIWRTSDSGWLSELNECEKMSNVHWIVVDYTGIETVPENWEEIEIEFDSDIHEGYRLLKWGEDFARCP